MIVGGAGHFIRPWRRRLGITKVVIRNAQEELESTGRQVD
jgi:hypothetical protein